MQFDLYIIILYYSFLHNIVRLLHGDKILVNSQKGAVQLIAVVSQGQYYYNIIL